MRQLNAQTLLSRTWEPLEIAVQAPPEGEAEDTVIQQHFLSSLTLFILPMMSVDRPAAVPSSLAMPMTREGDEAGCKPVDPAPRRPRVAAQGIIHKLTPPD
jgi:hypothetical protein